MAEPNPYTQALLDYKQTTNTSETPNPKQQAGQPPRGRGRGRGGRGRGGGQSQEYRPKPDASVSGDSVAPVLIQANPSPPVSDVKPKQNNPKSRGPKNPPGPKPNPGQNVNSAPANPAPENPAPQAGGNPPRTNPQKKRGPKPNAGTNPAPVQQQTLPAATPQSQEPVPVPVQSVAAQPRNPPKKVNPPNPAKKNPPKPRGPKQPAPVAVQETQTVPAEPVGPGKKSDLLANPHSHTGPGNLKNSKKVKKAIEGHSQLTSHMITQLMNDSYECIVCCERVGRKANIWNCSKCFRIFHVSCITKWSRSSLREGGRWLCPGCRAEANSPPESSCFCSKARNPPFDPYMLPHSCGEECGKLREGNCPHPCVLGCHPGPCPDCSAMGPLKECYCGKTTYRKLCGQVDPGQSCNATCGKALSCGRHQCDRACHPGDCGPCPEQIKRKCFCGTVTEDRSCGTEEMFDMAYGPADLRTFSCKNPCNRELSCGHHKCQQTCHPSTSKTSPTCPPCPLSPELIVNCPCGARSLEMLGVTRTSCEDPIPTCGLICSKILSCGRHKCELPCHNGPCPEKCTKSVVLPCACGTQPPPAHQFVCGDVYPDKYNFYVSNNHCKRNCGVQKECGKHLCSMKCCPSRNNVMDPAGHHICTLPCKKKLNCGIHTCTLPCHKGRCFNCVEAVMQDVRCPCGKTVHYAPIPCGSRPPHCNFPCPKQPACGHPATPHECHWSGACPPCVILVEKPCVGGHVLLKAVACSKKEIECGRTCEKPMHCGLHTCKRKCHSGPCELPLPPALSSEPTTDSEKSDDTILEGGQDPPGSSEPQDGEGVPPKKAFKSCGQKCLHHLSTCTHKCQSICHEGPCPDVKCIDKTKVWCVCGRISDMLPCTGLKDISLPCDETCLKELRQRKLAEAFGISPSDSTKPPTYSDLLLNAAKALPTFVKTVESIFMKLLKSTDSQVKLSPMDSVQRQIVHELAKYYFLETESVGTDQNRYVVLSKKIGSRPPLFTLSQVASMQSSLPAVNSISKDVVQTHGAAHLAASANPMSTLHLYDLSRSVKTTHLQHFLRDFEGLYVLQWIDESNALAIFHQPNFFVKALSTLNDSTGIIKVRAYKDTNPTSDRQGNVVLGEKYVPPMKRNPPEGVETTPPPPVEVSDFKTVVSGSKKRTLDPTESIQTTNMFSALLDQNPQQPTKPSPTPAPAENAKFDDWEEIPKPKEDQVDKKDDETTDDKPK